jgi:hypothetical protein
MRNLMKKLTEKKEWDGQWHMYLSEQDIELFHPETGVTLLELKFQWQYLYPQLEDHVRWPQTYWFQAGCLCYDFPTNGSKIVRTGAYGEPTNPTNIIMLPLNQYLKIKIYPVRQTYSTGKVPYDLF